MFFLADIDLDVLWFGALANDHSSIDFLTSADKQSAAVLSAEQTIGDRFSRFKGN